MRLLPLLSRRGSNYTALCCAIQQPRPACMPSNRGCPRTHAPVRSFQLFTGAKLPTEQTAQDLFERIQKLYAESIGPINARLHGPLEPSSEHQIPYPLVFVLGNFSSGKSTFINFALGRNVQAVGQAPTDDSFTIIAPGDIDADQDGPALVGDSSLGFVGLSQFGTQLVNHVALKIRKDTQLKDVMIVDSPGMIDSPVTSSSLGGRAAVTRGMERGYDFAATVKWFAERADVILLFQDPNKPGTTGETLDVMVSSLAGFDYKTHIVLNKSDLFSSVHDFARAYGALAWNLSKVMGSRKDLPPIYTMCVPTPEGAAGSGPAAGSAARGGVLLEAKADLDRARGEMLSEVHRAPLRRIDNMITRLNDSARLLRMHATVLQAVKRSYYAELLRWTAMASTGIVGLTGASTALMYIGAVEVGIPLAIFSLAAGTGVVWFARRQLHSLEESITHGAGLDEAFRKSHFMELADRNEVVSQVWERTRPQLVRTLRNLGIHGVASAKRSELAALDLIIAKTVPSLRLSASKAGAIYVPASQASGGGGGDAASSTPGAAGAAATAASILK